MAKATGIRARVRAELTAEIAETARRHLREQGPGQLSLRAVARELGMASSAIYRYFPSRDELLTRLIIDAYDDLADQVETARRDDVTSLERWLAVTAAFRDWSAHNPHLYALIYGSPVPGYVAPETTIPSAARVPRALLEVLFERPLRAAVEARPPLADVAVAPVLAELPTGTTAVEAAAIVAAWGEVSGLVGLERFGHFVNVVDDPDAFFTHAMTALAERVWATDPGAGASA